MTRRWHSHEILRAEATGRHANAGCSGAIRTATDGFWPISTFCQASQPVAEFGECHVLQLGQLSSFDHGFDQAAESAGHRFVWKNRVHRLQHAARNFHKRGAGCVLDDHGQRPFNSVVDERGAVSLGWRERLEPLVCAHSVQRDCQIARRRARTHRHRPGRVQRQWGAAHACFGNVRLAARDELVSLVARQSLGVIHGVVPRPKRSRFEVDGVESAHLAASIRAGTSRAASQIRMMSRWSGGSR